MMRSFITFTLRQGQVREDESCRACSRNWEKRNVYRILIENQKEKDH
jgi:hypothetical protein